MTAALVLLFAVVSQAAEYAAPAGVRPAIRRPGAASILPGGRIVAPIGLQYITGPGPFGLAISPSGKFIVSANRGPERFSLTILERDKTGHRAVRHVVTNGETEEWRGVSTGVAFDGERTVYVSEGVSGRIQAFNPSDGTRKRGFDLNQDGARDSFAGELAFDPDRKLLYALDETNSRLAVIDVNRRRIASLPVGGPPRTLALSPDRRRAYVVIGGESKSVAIVNLDNAAAPSIAGSVLTGGNPSSVAAMADVVFVADSAQDSVTAIDAKTNQVTATVPIRIPGLENLRGVAPVGLAFHAPTGWLLVAEAGANAVGIIDTKQMTVIGHMPVGWRPARLLIDGDEAFVSNTQGQGDGPNTGQRVVQAGYIATLRRGSVTAFPIPSAAELAEMTGRVMSVNGYTPKLMPGGSGIPDAIRHVVLIVKGNRSFDDVLGDIREAANGSVMGSAGLARFGRNGYADGKNVRLSLHRIDMTPNHHRLAETFSFSDNFYADDGLAAGTVWERFEREAVLLHAPRDTADQARASEFIGQIEERYGEGKAALPPLLLMRLPNDRMRQPEEGFPYEASYVGDNDYALGRIVEFLSHSPWWREMAIFVTEEDSGGLDHIDAHRTILLCVGPYFKKNYVSHVNASFPSLEKTVSRILHLPPVNLFDATAADLADTFTDTPDFAPYTALQVDKRVFDPEKLKQQR